VIKIHIDLHVSTRYSCNILVKFEFYRQAFTKYQISWKSVQCQPSCSMRTNGRRDMAKLFL